MSSSLIILFFCLRLELCLSTPLSRLVQGRLRCGSKSRSTTRNHHRSAKRLKNQSLYIGTVNYSCALTVMRTVSLVVQIRFLTVESSHTRSQRTLGVVLHVAVKLGLVFWYRVISSNKRNHPHDKMSGPFLQTSSRGVASVASCVYRCAWQWRSYESVGRQLAPSADKRHKRTGCAARSFLILII